jgi:hypothetical protein
VINGDSRDVRAEAPHHFFGVGLQYYVAGRAAARARQIPVAGNLLHHCIEMLLKAELSKTMSLGNIKKQFSHDLLMAWAAFKNLHHAKDLSPFDELIADLDRFERIRYPDESILHGAAMSIGWGTVKPQAKQITGTKVPEYYLYVNEVDTLVARLFVVCSVSPKFFFGGLHEEAVRALAYENAHYKGWFD